MRKKPLKILRKSLLLIWFTFLGAALFAGASSRSSYAARKERPPKPPRGNHSQLTIYEGSKTCNACHPGKALEVYNSEHYQWKGKLGAVNDFCIYPDTNYLFQFPAGSASAAGCATCHVGFGDTRPLTTAGASFPVTQFPSTPPPGALDKIDCLMCHSDTYNHTGQMVNGQPVLVPDAASQANMSTILANITLPSKQACLKCHAKAGGGDGIKQGDMDLRMANPSHALDVHMASTANGGAGFTCVSCHTTTAHKIAGKGSDLRVTDATGMKTCATCHGNSPHASENLNEHVGRADCTTCHIPTFARDVPPQPGVLTELRRDFTNFEQIGNRYEALRTTDADVTPKLLPYNGTSFFYQLGDTLTRRVMEGGLQRYLIAGPSSVAGGSTTGKRYPFKVHTAYMPVDASNRLMPLNSAKLWGAGELGAALPQFGSTPAGYVETVRYLGLYHQVAPKDQASQACVQCHSGGIHD